MALDLGHTVDDLGRSQGIADAPAHHRIGLGDAVDDDRLFLDVLAQRGEAPELEVVEEKS